MKYYIEVGTLTPKNSKERYIYDQLEAYNKTLIEGDRCEGFIHDRLEDIVRSANDGHPQCKEAKTNWTEITDGYYVAITTGGRDIAHVIMKKICNELKSE